MSLYHFLKYYGSSTTVTLRFQHFPAICFKNFVPRSEHETITFPFAKALLSQFTMLIDSWICMVVRDYVVAWNNSDINTRSSQLPWIGNVSLLRLARSNLCYSPSQYIHADWGAADNRTFFLPKLILDQLKGLQLFRAWTFYCLANLLSQVFRRVCAVCTSHDGFVHKMRIYNNPVKIVKLNVSATTKQIMLLSFMMSLWCSTWLFIRSASV